MAGEWCSHPFRLKKPRSRESLARIDSSIQIKTTEFSGTIELIEEPYMSIQGEGRHMGEPMVFIRTALCPVGCHWCDSRYTWSRGQIWDFEKLREKVELFDCPNLWITGGEPLIRAKELARFIQQMKSTFRWFICTSGSLWNNDITALMSHIDHVCLDYKLKSAQVNIPTRREFVDFLLTERRNSSELKCVVERPDDWDEVRELADLTYPDVDFTVQPMYEAWTDSEAGGGRPVGYEHLQTEDGLMNQSPRTAYAVWAEGFLRELHNYPQARFLPQWHKIIWPKESKEV